MEHITKHSGVTLVMDSTRLMQKLLHKAINDIRLMCMATLTKCTMCSLVCVVECKIKVGNRRSSIMNWVNTFNQLKKH